jgi:Spy/CpxP family protein refolding chaperone
MRSMIHRLRVPSLLAAGLLLGAPAFAAPPPNDTAQTQRTQDTRAQDATKNGATPVDKVVRGIQLQPHQQTAVARIKQDEEAAIPPLRDAVKSFDSALADQVRKGTVDPGDKDLKAKIDTLADATEKWRDTEDSAMDKLHGILDNRQRAEVAPRVATHAKDLAEPKPDLPRLAKTLNLTATQRREVDKVIRDESKDMPPATGSAQAKVPTKEVTDSFKKDDFKMETYMPPSDARSKTADIADKQVDMTKKIVDVLTPEQRDKLADELSKQGAFKHDAIMTTGQMNQKQQPQKK